MFCVYREMLEDSGKTVFRTIYPRQPGELEGSEVIAPYATKTVLQYKRFLAQSNGTTYVHDFPEIFRQATRAMWGMAGLEAPRKLIDVTDYVLGADDELVAVASAPDEYVVAMVQHAPGNTRHF